MNPRARDSELPDWKLERFLLGELDSTEMARIRRKAEEDASVRQRIEALQQSNREILDRYPVERMSRLLRQRSTSTGAESRGRARASHRGPWEVRFAAVLAAAVALILILPQKSERNTEHHDRPITPIETRIKGLQPELRLFRKTEFGSERLENGAKAREGDLILVQYEAAGQPYGVILSVDGNGSTTRHLPLEGEVAQQLTQDGAVSLNYSYELDDAPRWERFYFVTGDSSFSVHVVVASIRKMMQKEPAADQDSLSLPHSLQQRIFTLQKESSRE